MQTSKLTLPEKGCIRISCALAINSLTICEVVFHFRGKIWSTIDERNECTKYNSHEMHRKALRNFNLLDKVNGFSLNNFHPNTVANSNDRLLKFGELPPQMFCYLHLLSQSIHRLLFTVGTDKIPEFFRRNTSSYLTIISHQL